MNMAYTEKGSFSHPPIVFLHAFPVHRAMWNAQVEGLSDRARCLAIDYPGFGESTDLSIDPSMASYADSVIRFLDEKGIDRAILAGCSMGGYIAFELWRRAHERVSGMILFDTKAEADTEEARQTRHDMAKKVTTEGMEPVAEAMVPKLLGQSTHDRHPEIVQTLRDWIRTAKPEAVATAQQAMAGRPDSLETLARIDVPVLLLFGDEDGITTPAFGQTMLKHLPDAHLEVIPYAGHLSPMEQPDSVNAQIASFLERLA